MANRHIEVFTAGCPCCDEAVEIVRDMACSNCEITIYNYAQSQAGDEIRQKASGYRVKQVPAVVVDGNLASCCAKGGIDRDVLADMGVGSAN